MDLEAEKRFHELLENALDLEGEDLTHFLDEECAEQPELAGRLRQALVTLDEGLFRQPSGVEQVALEELAFGVPPQGLSEGPITIGPYRLIELLGSGGMGRVFLAEQTEPWRRQVALKLLKTSLGGKEARIRFKAEQQALARLDHPNVGRILEAGTTDDDAPYFAMELVTGEPLIRYCDTHKLSLRQRLGLMVAVCRGVEHAHRKQILHRDLKPSNVMIAEVDGQAVPKIIDFGIAKALDQPLTDATLATGGFLGTPTYMSPEALEGSGDLDTRTDVYSLGVLLYELLTGVKPFEVETGGFASLVIRLREEDTPRPSTRWGHLDTQARERLAANRQTSMVELERRLRHELDWVVLKAMAKNRDQRYGSAAALAEDLERYLAHEPLVASPPSFGYHFSKLLRRHRLAVGLLVGLTVLGTSAVGYHLRSRRLVSDRSAELTREIERIDWMQRVAYQLPPGDRSAEHQLIRQGMARIEAAATALGGLDRGGGDYALGRGAMALHRLDEAYGHLQAAWEAGYRRPEAALSLGLVLSDLYESRLDRARLLPSRSARRVARQKAGNELRDPAIEMLTAGRQSSVVSPSLLEAHIALLQDDVEEDSADSAPDDVSAPIVEAEAQLDQVLSLSLTALEERPWLYEAHFLRARALGRQADRATRNNELDRADELLQQAVEAIRQGLAIGRSDPDGYLRLCETSARRLGFIVRHIRPGVDEQHAQTLEACATARQIDPDRVDVDLVEAGAWLDLIDVEVWDRNEDPSSSMAEAERLLRGYLELRPDSSFAYQSLARAQNQLAVFQMRSGEDPRVAQGTAIELLQEALRLEPHDAALHENLCTILNARGDYEMNRGGDPRTDLAAAEHHGILAVEGAPDELTAYLYLGITYIRRAQYRVEHGIDPSADFEEGLRRFQLLLDKWPSNGPAPNAIANMLMLRGLWETKQGSDPSASFEEAIPFAEQALVVNPDAAFPLFVRGQVKMWLAHYAITTGRDGSEWASTARRDIELGFEKLPNLPGPFVELSILALAEGHDAMGKGQSPLDRVAEAQSKASRSLAIDPERADAQRLLAEAELLRAAWLMKSGGAGSSLTKARGYAEAALAMEPGDAENHLAMARYAWRHLQADGVPDEDLLDLGLKHCDLAAEIDPTAMYGNVLRGVLLMQDSDRLEEGQRLVAEAIDANPNLEYLWGGFRR